MTLDSASLRGPAQQALRIESRALDQWHRPSGWSYRGQMDLDGVEIKANLTADDLDRVERTLEVGDDKELSIYFHEDTTTGQSLPLLAAGVIIRGRFKEGRDEGDSTVKLRPCRASQVAERWFDPRRPPADPGSGFELRFEEDWSGSRRVLAASCQVELNGRIADQTSERPPLSDDQLRFLTDCAPLRVNPAELTRLGPIRATKFGEVRAGGLAELEAKAERWRVAELDFIEVSVKVEEGDPEQVQRDLLAGLASLGLTVAAEEKSKTQQVLEALAAG